MAAQKREVARLASTWDDIEQGYAPTREFVDCGDKRFEVQELSGRARFDAAEKADEDRWEMMLWLCDKGIVAPRAPDLETFEKHVAPEHVLKIAKAIMGLSGMKLEDEEEAGNESAGESESGG